MIIRTPDKLELTTVECIIDESLRLVSDDPTLRQSLAAMIREDFTWWSKNCENSICRVAELDGSVVGVILVKEFCRLTDLFVLPAYHHRGIARALVESAIDLCREQSPTGKLTLNSSNAAKGFYEKLGFVPAGEPKDLPGGCWPFELPL